jgi:hypothetical protein
MRYGRTDANHGEIVEYLRAHGWSVHDLSQAGHGIPDILCSRAGSPQNWLLEIKIDKKARLKPAQIEFHNSWPGQKAIVTSGEEALEILEGKRPTRFCFNTKGYARTTAA